MQGLDLDQVSQTGYTIFFVFTVICVKTLDKTIVILMMLFVDYYLLFTYVDITYDWHHGSNFGNILLLFLTFLSQERLNLTFSKTKATKLGYETHICMQLISVAYNTKPDNESS